MNNDPCDQDGLTLSRTGLHRKYFQWHIKSVLEKESCAHLHSYCDITLKVYKNKDGAVTESDHTVTQQGNLWVNCLEYLCFSLEKKAGSEG